MVIAPVTPKGLDALVPQPAKPNEQKEDSLRTVVISINKDKSLMINQDATREIDLQSRLEDIFKTRAERVVFVKGDPDLEYRYVANIIDIAHGAGIDKVGLMTEKVEAGQ
jgi:biopolymer transport protein ExbD